MSKSTIPNPDLAVAVVGLSCRFPGAESSGVFWSNLIAGRESISRFTEAQLVEEGVDAGLRSDPEYVAAAGVLDDVGRFDANLFGYLPREAGLIDPQQRIFLECAWHALEDAGIAPRGPRAGRFGVFAGATANTYLLELVRRDPGAVERFGEQTMMLANDKDFLPLRTAWQLGLDGPAVNIQSACATSLVAVHYAVRSLVVGECDVALAGGASVRVPHLAGYLYREHGTMSRDGHCRPFDARAGGSVPGSGAGVLVLKRLQDAVQDVDAIHAVILGTGLSADGRRKSSFTAPSADGQRRATLDALAAADINSETLRYVEGHGTATRLGDPLEVQGLAAAFRETTNRTGFCGLGSVKSNIGHLDAAAGVAGLIKTILSLEHKRVPRTLHFTRPSPDLHLDDSPFFVAGDDLDLADIEAPLRASVNGIGMGGVNAHVILQEAPEAAARPPARAHSTVLPLAAFTATALDTSHRRLSEHVQREHDIELAEAARTLQTGRAAMPFRRSIVCRPDRWRHDIQEQLNRPCAHAVEDLRLVVVVPGQGVSDTAAFGMLIERDPALRSAFDEIAALAAQHGQLDLHDVVKRGARSTRESQPLRLAMSWALLDRLRGAGLTPDTLVGHSLGEWIAACWAGLLPIDGAVEVVCARGRWMEAAPPGAMTAVALTDSAVIPYLEQGVFVAASNESARCVIAGPVPLVETTEAKLRADSVTYNRVPVDRAFHTPAMANSARCLQQLLSGLTMTPPQHTVISALTGARLTSSEAQDPSYWGRHVLEPVRFHDAVEAALAPGPALVVVAGAAPGLCGSARRHPNALDLIEVPGPDGDECATRVAARAWELGCDVEWKIEPSTRTARLTGYPFEGTTAWLPPRRSDPAPSVDTSPIHTGQTFTTSAAGGLHAEVIITGTQLTIRTHPDGLAPHLATPVMSASGPTSGPTQHAPDVAHTVCAIFTELLGIENLTVESRLAALGVDSMMQTQLLSRLRSQLTRELTMRDLAHSVSIADLVAVINRRIGGETAPQPAPPQAPAHEPETDLDELVEALRGMDAEQLEAELASLEDDEV